MAIVTVKLSYNSRLIDFTYDNSIVSLALENGNHVVFTFIGNLFPKNNFDSGISVDRNDRDILHVGIIKDSPFVPLDQIETKSVDYVEVVTKFAIRLGLDNTQSAIVAFTESIMVEEVKEEPTPTGVKVNYTKDSTFNVLYTDTYGTPITHSSFTDYDIVQVVSGDKINITSTHQDLKVTIIRVDEYGTPLANYVKVVDNGMIEIEIENEMLVANEIDMVVELIEVEPPIELRELIVNVNYVGTNYTTSLNGVTQLTYVENTPLAFTITADSGYTFNGSNGKVEILDMYETPTDSVLISGLGKTVNVTMNLDSLLNNSKVDIYITPTPDLEQIVDVNQFINLYRVTTSVLSELATKRYGIVNNEIYDYGERITNLYRLPIEVDNSLIVENENIVLGDYDTNVKADLISDYIMKVHIDEITVPEIYNNSLDYVGVDCTLYLPFVSSITIEPRYCINQTISIEYSLNLLSGSVTINLYSSYSDELFHSSTEQISMQLPYLQGVNVHSPIGQLITTDINDISLAYIEVNRNKLANVNSIGFNQNRTGNLIDYVGYVEVSNIKLNSNATIGEMIDIENMLRNGVYINE